MHWLYYSAEIPLTSPCVHHDSVLQLLVLLSFQRVAGSESGSEQRSWNLRQISQKSPGAVADAQTKIGTWIERIIRWGYRIATQLNICLLFIYLFIYFFIYLFFLFFYLSILSVH